MLDVVEGDEVGKVHEGRIVHVNVHLDAGRKALQPAHRFVGKKTHGAGGEWRQAGQGHGAVTRAHLTQAIEDVTGFFLPLRAPGDGNSIAARGNHRKRVNAEESVPPNSLPTFHALQQKAVGMRLGGRGTVARPGRGLRGKSQVSRNRAEQVRHNRPVNGHNVSLAGQALEFGESGFDVGHKNSCQLSAIG